MTNPRRDSDLNIEIGPDGPRVKEPRDWTPERALVEAKDVGFTTVLLRRMPFARLRWQSRLRREYAQRAMLYRQMTAEREHEEVIRTLLEAHSAPERPSQARPAIPTQRQPSAGLGESPASPRHLVQQLWPGYQSYVEDVKRVQASRNSVFVDQTIRSLACFTWVVALILLAVAVLSAHIQ